MTEDAKMRSVPVSAITAGDVLVLRSSARADLYEISVVPAAHEMPRAITPISCISTGLRD
jgi:hypothetical protein